ncbi:hypothetical protein [Flavobacterium ginsenosidimutans]|uniref:Colicin D immunity protein domain-containing protein n=1 Tax=Flavobacterium ginsenosidimutans TaxID=687844 RepID=A0ABZ2QDA9_9FLAO|nr:hypothetical protein [Flavobacterium ginsenosidimutans]KAF2331088.1 hypothetical protein DM444_12485 [Flavobacterium ginsenosidimutans]
MEIWLEKSLALVKNSSINLDDIDYKNMIYLFYEYFSDRNLAKFISCLYDLDETILLNEIYHVIANKEYDLDEVERIMVCLRKWILSMG